MTLTLLCRVSAQVRCPSTGTLDEAQLTDMVKDSAREPRARLFIATCGVSFPLTPEAEKRLRAAGATDNTIFLLREKAPKPADPKPPDPAPEKKPESAPLQTKPQIAPGSVRKGADGSDYVWIPAGTFQMGCLPGDRDCIEDEKPRHEVRISKGFWISKTEVTQVAYQRLTGSDPSYFKGPDLPVEKVSWDEAQKYCKAMQGRLPTEAEWEYAARAASRDLPHILGNIWQWMGDWYDEKYYQRMLGTDPQGPASGQYRGLRGGSAGDEDPRVSCRGKGIPGFLYYNVGFRCVREAIP
jgi:formylglycine-generating enzyme required for sulfatase activity